MSEVNLPEDLISIYGLLIQGENIAQPQTLFRRGKNTDGKAVETVVPRASDLHQSATAWSTKLEIKDINLTLSVALRCASDKNVLTGSGMKSGTWEGFCEGVEAYVVGTAIAGKRTESGPKSAKWLAEQLNDKRFCAYTAGTYPTINSRLTQFSGTAVDISESAADPMSQTARSMISQALERDDKKV